MVITDLPSDTFPFSLLNRVNKQVMDWQLEPVLGKGLYQKHESIAYVELKICGAKQKGHARSCVEWNISTSQLSESLPGYKAEIEESLLFFLRYMAALRGEPMYLTFEINDIAFDPTSTRANPLKKAAVYAILNCFDKNLFSFSQEVIRTLKEKLGEL